MTETRKIPFLDLVTPHQELREELLEVFNSSLNTAGFIGGPVVEEFEREFASFCGVSHCVGVGSGTDALRFALIAAGVGNGDIVVTVPNTFIATTEAISQAGARPVFVDIDEQTYNMDPQKLEQYLDDACRIDDKMGHLVDRMTGKRVAALVPVHLYGQMADMDKILELAERYNLVVIEDACQAHGAEYYSQKNQRWQKAGSLGRAAAFSFYPGKNLGACGEAGSVTTDDPELAQKVRMLRDHGQTYKYHHEIEGFNGRLDAIQAGILLVKLKHISEWTQLRRIAASWYRESLSNIQDKITLPCEPPWAKAVYHLFVVRVENRDELIRHLMSAGIATGIHYPIPIHLQKAYSAFGFREGDFPITERVAKEILSLPMFPGLQPEQQLVIAAQIATFVSTPCGLSVQL